MPLSNNVISSVPSGGQITAFPARAFDITPSDATVFENAVTVHVNTTGDVAVEPWSSTDVLTFTVADGQPVPVVVKRVLATGTTATGLIGLY